MEIVRAYTIVHVEDDAANWRPLTLLLYTAIGEYLDDKQPLAMATLKIGPPSDPHAYPAKTSITWSEPDYRTTIDYWLVNTARIDPIRNHLETATDITFILDVMRPKNKAGLSSSLEETLASIKSLVSDQESQVRLFTAYSQADGIEFPASAPEMFKKGIETNLLLEFLLKRIGIGG
jgi:hypothetical protein